MDVAQAVRSRPIPLARRAGLADTSDTLLAVQVTGTGSHHLGASVRERFVWCETVSFIATDAWERNDRNTKAGLIEVRYSGDRHWSKYASDSPG